MIWTRRPVNGEQTVVFASPKHVGQYVAGIRIRGGNGCSHRLTRGCALLPLPSRSAVSSAISSPSESWNTGGVFPARVGRTAYSAIALAIFSVSAFSASFVGRYRPEVHPGWQVASSFFGV